MTRQAPLICLITPGHVSSTPRLVKEADALAEAGYRVHVVCGRHFGPAEPLDQSIFSTASWQHSAVSHSAGAAAIRKMLREISRRLLFCLPNAGIGLAARAQHSEIFRLADAAARSNADFYVGHCVAGLSAAAFAAGVRGVPIGFDIEDFHDGEVTDDESAIGPRMDRLLQSSLLSRCRHLTASSPLIAAKYQDLYGVRATVVLNVFPLGDAPEPPGRPEHFSEDRPAVAYWFSQTIGPGRGLEAVIRVLGRMRVPAELRLRGFISAEYAGQLQELAIANGLRCPIVFLPPGRPRDMARLAAEADIGLSTEESRPLNHDLCLGNKIFTYLLAGVPQLLSTTTAQRAIANDLGEAVLLSDIQQTDATARGLDALLSNPERLLAARRAALQAGRTRYCWDIEKEKFLLSIRTAAGAPR